MRRSHLRQGDRGLLSQHDAAFEEVELQRVFIPRSKQVAESKDKPADDAAKKQEQESEDAMKKLADALRTRAAAGEDFEKLQDEAIAASEMKGKPPTKLGKVRAPACRLIKPEFSI